eukprot:PhF_6_TR9486/c0_g1_i2/m.14800
MTTLTADQQSATIDILHTAFRPLASKSDKDIEAIFKMLDADGSNTVDQKEIGKFFKSLNCELDDERTTFIVSELDKNGNSVIEFSELLVFVRSIQSYVKPIKVRTTGEAMSSTVKSAARAMLELALKPLQNLSDAAIQQAFQKIDTDKSEGIDVAEFKQYFASLGCTGLHDDNLVFLLQEVDSNKNGVIEFAEFIQFIRSFKN